MFTYNFFTKCAYLHGTSMNLTLFGLVLWLRLLVLEMRTEWKIHIIHVSGTQMIEQGTALYLVFN
jgi:hypothetical protein